MGESVSIVRWGWRRSDRPCPGCGVEPRVLVMILVDGKQNNENGRKAKGGAKRYTSIRGIEVLKVSRPFPPQGAIASPRMYE